MARLANLVYELPQVRASEADVRRSDLVPAIRLFGSQRGATVASRSQLGLPA